MDQLTSTERCTFLPLAITRSDEKYGCVGAITENGCWVRPEPIYVDDLTRPDTSYRYFYWTTAHLNPSTAEDKRPEDRDLSQTQDKPQIGSALHDTDRLPFLLRHADPDVRTAFVGERSLGLIEVSVDGFYVKRATGGRFFIRTEFCDSAGDRYDWIIPEITFGGVVWPHVVDGILSPSFAEQLQQTFQPLRTFFTIGLTKANNRFPGKFRNCHPLVVGIHSEPDYLPRLERNQGGS